MTGSELLSMKAGKALPPSSLTFGQGHGLCRDRTGEDTVGRGPGFSRGAQHQSC